MTPATLETILTLGEAQAALRAALWDRSPVDCSLCRTPGEMRPAAMIGTTYYTNTTWAGLVAWVIACETGARRVGDGGMK